VPSALVSLVTYVTNDDAMRDYANQARVELSQFAIDMFGQNITLYEAFKAYAEGNAKKESLHDEQKYFIKEEMDDFRRSGLHLSPEKRDKIKKLLKELSELSTVFQKNINTDNSFITVTYEQLSGLEDDFINALEKDKADKYILKTDYPTFFAVMDYANNPQTRERMYRLFNDRAYPQNIEVLNKIIAVRDELAKIIGFASYAALDIDAAMAKNPDRAYKFLKNLVEHAQAKEKQEFDQLKTDLPSSVKLVEGKFQPYDLPFAKATYKKKHFKLDDREVAKYFPMKKTIEGLLNIYEQFMDIDLKESSISGLWDPEVKLIEAYKKDKQFLGYLLLDLFPRPNKYNHACEITIVPAVKKDNEFIPAVAVVIANFSKPMTNKPSLLELDQVRTFFHEFGHAIHAIMGATNVSSLSGTNVKMDFVEMPSQMLEEWLWIPEILKMLSNHYQTDESLPDNLIETIIALKNFDSGYWVLRQALFSLMSLDYYASGGKKDVLSIMNQLKEQISPHLNTDLDNHMPASFGHLTGYGAKYYGYLWSKVFALDLFDRIKQFGLLNPEIGRQYVDKVIGQGGSKNPDELLKDFLGREPNADAFFKDLGLN
jgi:thimet oligopeptidase